MKAEEVGSGHLVNPRLGPGARRATLFPAYRTTGGSTAGRGHRTHAPRGDAIATQPDMHLSQARHACKPS
ncbi:hypothetical protein RGUI_0493 [Rhodovulum sp. P5]|nr:hypothetical protein RGUI_0493 [Rhodovulum sp. P5]